ncbi:SAM-dependent methyltransferase [Massilia endophytica]|uniref:hypothetical protein n=1 Tax=Massilia endophytica TaxID=2899220 RepID=UPI001E350FBB|nr:hypothetical protein [Massilia endophytica]UGQ48213.1 hypothetical protein LSQ66_07050 [Massilia endophytica]
MSPEDRAELRELARAIASPARERESLMRESAALRLLLERCTGLRPEDQPLDDSKQTSTAAGLALSPLRAAMCAREPLRTITFIKGLAAAIEQARRPERPVRVLYAGCGPFATLALPLMALSGAQEAEFTLADIHAASLDCARGLVEGFGLASHVSGYVLADACTMILDPAQLPDVIVSETMNASLRSEPQVAIMRHLAAQAPGALLVPESVTVEACLLRLGKELPPPLEGPDAKPQPAQRERIGLGPVFRLDREAIEAWKKEGGLLPAGAVRIPSEVPAGMQARLLTKIVAFGPHRLDDYECSLNLPQHFPGRPALAGGEQLQFAYRISDAPGLVLLETA